jgi:hypothetical protein
MLTAPVHSIKNAFKNQTPKQAADKLKAKSSMAGLLPLAVGMVSGFSLDHTAFLSSLDTIGHGFTGLNIGEISSGAAKMSHVWFHASGAAGTLVNCSIGITTVLGASVGISEIWAGTKTHSYSMVGMGLLDLAASSAFPLVVAGLGVPAIGIAIGVGAAECILAFSRKMSSVQKANSTFKLLNSWTGVAMLTGVAVAPAAFVAGLTKAVKMFYLNNSSFRKRLSKFFNPFRHHENSKSLSLDSTKPIGPVSETKALVSQSGVRKQVFQVETRNKPDDARPLQDSVGSRSGQQFLAEMEK